MNKVWNDFNSAANNVEDDAVNFNRQWENIKSWEERRRNREYEKKMEIKMRILIHENRNIKCFLLAKITFVLNNNVLLRQFFIFDTKIKQFSQNENKKREFKWSTKIQKLL